MGETEIPGDNVLYVKKMFRCMVRLIVNLQITTGHKNNYHKSHILVPEDKLIDQYLQINIPFYHKNIQVF